MLSVVGWYAFGRSDGYATPSPDRHRSKLIAAILLIHYTFLVFCLVGVDPSSQVSYGKRQPKGPCDVVALDISGNTRFKNVCVDHFHAKPSAYEFVQEPFALSSWLSSSSSSDLLVDETHYEITGVDSSNVGGVLLTTGCCFAFVVFYTLVL